MSAQDDADHPIFSRRRPDPRAPRGLQLRRVEPGKILSGICLSHDLVGTYTHYYRGRTRACCKLDCAACLARAPRRWYSYLVAMNERTRQLDIFEITDEACETFEKFFAEHRTLRGYSVAMKRRNERANSRVLVSIAGPRLDDVSIPKAPDPIPMLLRMWEFDLVGPQEVSREREVRIDPRTLPGQTELPRTG